MKKHRDIYLSLDIEANGPIPGPYSMLSLGAAAFDIEGKLLGTFSRNLLPLEGSSSHPETDAFWAKNPQAYAATQTDRCDPAQAMRDYDAYLRGLPVRPVLMGYPAAYDHMWHSWYLHKFVGADYCGHSSLDLKTYACALLRVPFRQAAKRGFPAHWFEGAPQHDHVALNDAIGQGMMGIVMLREHLGMAPVAREEGR
jgi:hypothetical protein